MVHKKKAGEQKIKGKGKGKGKGKIAANRKVKGEATPPSHVSGGDDGSNGVAHQMILR